MAGRVYRIVAEGIGVGLCVLLLFSCVSFSIADAPSGFVWPNNNPPQNWCGTVGAFCAYYLIYYLGPGVFVLLGAFLWGLLVRLSGRRADQPILRFAGLVLVVCSISSAWYLLWPYKQIWPYGAGVFPVGAGGVIGIAAGGLLKAHLATLGTVVVLICAGVVGAILLADTATVAVLGFIGSGAARMLGFARPAFSAAKEQSKELSNIWKRLSEKQRQTTPKIASPVAGMRARQEAIAEDKRMAELKKASLQQLAAKAATPARTEPVRAGPAAAKKTETEIAAQKGYEDYTLPPLELLREPEHGFAAVQEKMVDHKAQSLELLLSEFGINAHVVNAEPGPAITMYELELAPGIKVSQISNLSNDMARALGAQSVRVVAPLAGRHTIGIEVPNSQREIVRIKDLIERAVGAERMYLPLYLGKSSSGEVLLEDLADMPHLLIAGTTGSGKSVCINSIITSILLTRRPDEVKLILIDPKMVEMASFESIPHLMCPTVTETKRAEQILEWATTKMDERYELLAEAKVRNIASYNNLTTEEIIERFQPSTAEEEAKIPKKMPHIIIVIDELADLMMTAAKEIESYIVRLAQKSRAVGIHLVVATQRPQATVVTGLIKSNMPARVGFRVAARMDSRIILDQNGAETLLGQGDMLFMRPGVSDLVRSQGAYVDDDEVKAVVGYLKNVAQPQYHPELMQLNRIDTSMAERDDLFDEAIRVVLETKRGSVSLLQRRLSIGYARASRIIEMMAAAGILGEYKGSQAREVTMTLEEYEALKKDMITEEVAGYEDISSRPDRGEDEDSDDEPEEE